VFDLIHPDLLACQYRSISEEVVLSKLCQEESNAIFQTAIFFRNKKDEKGDKEKYLTFSFLEIE
jgi:hypothetical protein